MGAGAVTGTTTALNTCSDEDLKLMCKAMPAAERAKLLQAITGTEEAKAEAAAEVKAEAKTEAKADDAGGAATKRRNVIGGNWKCNPATLASVKELCVAFKEAKFDKTKVEAIICASTVHAATVAVELAGTDIEVGIQNISKTATGAFTGETPAAIAKDAGYSWCLIGHSERRSLYGETIEDTVEKLKQAQEAGLKVMFCIGEQLAEREAGETDKVNKAQLEPVLGMVKDWETFVIAYEPVWAIGTGKVATPEQAQETQANIRSFVKEKCGADVADKVRIQYGGSASPDNIEGLVSQPDIDGFLVGGASLKPGFVQMIEHLGK